MNIYSLISFSCLLISSIAFWRLLIVRNENHKIALITFFILIATWANIFIFGVSHIIGLLSLCFSFMVSIATIYISIYINKKKTSHKLSKKIMREIELAYIEKYKHWSNCDGPSLLGTMNDYYRLLMHVLGPFEEKYPIVIDNHCEEICKRLREITKTIN